MSLPRLPFLYPHLFKSIRACDGQPAWRPLTRTKQAHPQTHKFHTGSRRRQATYPQRYGPAAEPISLPPDVSQKPIGPQSTGSPARNSKARTTKASPVGKDPNNSRPRLKDAALKEEEAALRQIPAKDANTMPEQRQRPVEPTPVAQLAPPTKEEAREEPLQQAIIKPLEKVLHMEAPSSTKPDEHKPPHLHTPPYVHHFDTYSLVQDLEKGGFSQDQSITFMKAIRGLLAVNLDMARDGLVSKSDVENETYLFRAACSELRTEVQNSRNKSNEKMRTERAHLQHEADILNQKVTQESLTLKDDLRGMFNDRKMAVRMEQRGMESAIQELNYKITVALNSDSKGEVEGLRWFLTRRAAIFIASMALLILGSLRYSSYMIHMQNYERQKMDQQQASKTSDGGGSSGGNFTVPSRSAGTQTGPVQGGEADVIMASMESGSTPSYVSLG